MNYKGHVIQIDTKIYMYMHCILKITQIFTVSIINKSLQEGEIEIKDGTTKYGEVVGK